MRARLRFFFSFGQANTNQLTDAVLFHGHPVEHVGFGDRALVVSDHHELTLMYKAI